MTVTTNYETLVAGILKGEIKRQNLKYSDLVKKLADIGIEEKEVNIRNKLARGKFSAAFMVQCLHAIGVRDLRL